MRAGPTDWPFFRGPTGTGIADATPPLTWNSKTGKNVLWSVPVPLPGLSSPIVWGDLILVTGATKNIRKVFAFDAHTGKESWTYTLGKIKGSPEKPPSVSEDTGYAAPTMAANADALCASFANGDVICLDHKGNKIWSLNLGVEKNTYGYASSLLMAGPFLIVQYDNDEKAYVYAFDIKSGKRKWKRKRKNETAWTSPSLVKFQGKPTILLNGVPHVVLYDVKKGKEIWTRKCMEGELGASAAIWKDMVYVGNEYHKYSALSIVDGKTLWTEDEYTPHVASPVAAEGLILMPLEGGEIACLDAKTGELLWIETFDEDTYSSPIYASGKFYITDYKGKTFIIAARREYELLSTGKIEDIVNTTPAFSGKRIYIRGEKNLFCIE